MYRVNKKWNQTKRHFTSHCSRA